MPREINLTPDFAAMFNLWTREFKIAAERPHNAEELRLLQSLIAPLNVAIQCCTRIPELQGETPVAATYSAPP